MTNDGLTLASLTYFRFLVWFVVPPLLVVLWKYRRPLVQQATWRELLPLLLVVYLAASPWDNLAAAGGLWWFPEGKTLGLKIAHLPIEEYAFFGLQTLLTGVWAGSRLVRRLSSTVPTNRAALQVPR